MHGKADQTNKVCWKDVSSEYAMNHWVKFGVKVYGTDECVYPFAQHERFGGYALNYIFHNRTLFQTNYWINQNKEIKQCSIQALATLLWNINSEN